MRVAFANPKAHHSFMVMFAISIVFTLAALVLAFLFGGGFWWSFVIGLASAIAIYGLSEVSGANNEVIIPEAPSEEED